MAGPSSEVAVGEIAAKAVVLGEVHSRSLKMTGRDSAEALKAAHTLVLRNCIPVAALEDSDTFQLAEHCAAGVVGRCSIDCQIVHAVGCVLGNSSKRTDRRP